MPKKNTLEELLAGMTPEQIQELSLTGREPSPKFGLPQSGVNAPDTEKYGWMKSLISGIGDVISASHPKLTKDGGLDEEALQDMVLNAVTPMGLISKGAKAVGKAAGEGTDLLSTIRKLQTPGQERELVSISKLREAWEGGGKNNAMLRSSEGRPLIVYHGTDKELFDIFRPGWREPGIFLTPVEENAWKFAKGVGEPSKTAKVIASTVDIKNPLVVDGRTGTNGLYPLTEDTLKQLKSKGYDGIIALGPSGKVEHAREIIPFDPNQIKRIGVSTSEMGSYGRNADETISRFRNNKGIREDTSINRGRLVEDSSLDSQLLQLAKEGKVALHRGDPVKGGKGLTIDGEYYVGVVPKKGMGLEDTLNEIEFQKGLDLL